MLRCALTCRLVTLSSLDFQFLSRDTMKRQADAINRLKTTEALDPHLFEFEPTTEAQDTFRMTPCQGVLASIYALDPRLVDSICFEAATLDSKSRA